MSFWTVETIVGFSGGRPGFRSRFSGCSDAIAHALGDELLLEVGDSTGGFDPAPETARGLSLSLTQTVGAQGEGGAAALLERHTLADLGASEEDDLSSRRLDGRIGYGLGVLDDRYTATPELGLSDSDRELRLGWRLTERVTTGLAFELGLKGTRREFTNGEAGPEHGLGAGLGWTLQGSRGGGAFGVRLEAARLQAANDDRPTENRIGLSVTARW